MTWTSWMTWGSAKVLKSGPVSCKARFHATSFVLQIHEFSFQTVFVILYLKLAGQQEDAL